MKGSQDLLQECTRYTRTCSHYPNTIMWYLVQRSPDGLRALSASDNRERLEFMLLHRYKRFLPNCDYAIMHSGHLPLT